MSKPRPSSEVIEDASLVAKNNKRLVNFIREWKERECAELPLRTDNVAVCQGRCQVLMELVKFLEEAPDIVAKS